MNQLHIKILLIGVILVVIGFTIGFKSSIIAKKQSPPDWYQKKIESYIPMDIVKPLILKPCDCNKLKKKLVKEPHEQLQPKLFKLTKRI